MKWIEGICPIRFPGLGWEINPPAGFSIGALNFNFYGNIIALGLILCGHSQNPAGTGTGGFSDGTFPSDSGPAAG